MNNIESWKAFVPIYCKYELIKLLGLDTKIVFKTLIPIINLYYFNIIIKKLLEVTSNDPVESIWYLIFPMYKFPEMILRNPSFNFAQRVEEPVISNQTVDELLEISDDNVEPLFNVNKDSGVYVPSTNEPQIKEEDELIVNPSQSTETMNTLNICPNCNAILKEKVNTCPTCGFKFR